MTKIAAPPYSCNVCGKARHSDVNHWFILFIGNNFRDRLERENFPSLHLVRWLDIIADLPNAAHACGQDHALVLATRWLATGSFGETSSAGTSSKLEGSS